MSLVSNCMLVLFAEYAERVGLADMCSQLHVRLTQPQSCLQHNSSAPDWRLRNVCTHWLK